MPRNTGAGFILAALSGVFGFAIIWHIWWLAALGLVAVLARRLHTLQLRARLPHPGDRSRRASRTGARACWRRKREAMDDRRRRRRRSSAGLLPGEEHEHAGGGSTLLGFWIYLMSDCLLFAALFATYGVLGGSYAGGPAPKDLFELPLVAVNTSMLLLSSITYGFAMLATYKGRVGATQAWLVVTALFGWRSSASNCTSSRT
jgi:hypothetical protein